MQNNNSCELFRYLRKHSKPKKGQETNTSMVGGKYFIMIMNIDAFLKYMQKKLIEKEIIFT